ncbi:MAG: GNAT family N-acetyltransferase, partial [bacterium]|nr:GNAT family N-acetyltransferase [bacterium]
GDIPHHIYSGNRLFDPEKLIRIWEDKNGIAAWFLAGPRHKSFDAQIRPDLSGSGLEVEMLKTAEEQTIEMMKYYNIESDTIYADSFRQDTKRSKTLLDLGWEKDDEPPYLLLKTELTNIPKIQLAERYSIRSVMGLYEADKLAEVHLASFGSKWTEASYKKLMQAPGYDYNKEYVVETGTEVFGGFTVTWHDELNKIGLFEPVGVHKTFRRQGLGKALIYHGFQQMKKAGMKHASVACFSSNSAAFELYKNCGFEIWHEQDSYSKKIK